MKVISLLFSKRVKHSPEAGFSLIEVVVSMGVIAFAMMTLVALLPAGVRQNQESAETVEAAGFLTAIAADLKNAPYTTATSSTVFGISPLPLTSGSAGKYRPNNTGLGTIYADGSTLTSTGATAYQFYIQRSGSLQTTLSTASSYRLTIRYTRAAGLGSATGISVPASGGLAPVEAHLIISWPPSLNPLSPADRNLLRGMVESYLTFPL